MDTGQLFYEWLLTQLHQQDALGDLAQVVLNDPEAKTVRNYCGDWARYLNRKGVAPSSKTALGRAWTQYRHAQRKRS